MVAVGWMRAAGAELLRLAGPSAWGERRGAGPRVEPTALAGLGLLAAGNPGDALGAVDRAAGWLARQQRADGAFGIGPGLTEPNWPTPLAALFLAAHNDNDAPARRAAGWLLTARGEVVPGEARTVVGHDVTLVGWPWVAGTHSWLEPTALAVLALRRLGRGDHPRVAEGLRLIRDRAIPSGGWNYGNKAVLGRTLRPQPGPTGVALLALAGAGPESSAVRRGLAYLEEALPAIRSAESLGWGVLGLRAWGRGPSDADSWLGEAYARVTSRPDAAPRLALLLLAGGDGAMGVLGTA